MSNFVILSQFTNTVVKLIPFLVISIFFATENISSAQQHKQVIKDSMIYHFMNDIDSDHYGKIKFETITNKTTNIKDYLTESGLKKYFTADDTTFMREQFDNRSEFKWDSVKLKYHFRVVEDNNIERCFHQKEDGWKVYKQKYGGGYADYSIPLFSKDLKHAFIYKGYHCGWLCGDGYIYVFEKVNGKWKMIYERVIWIS